MKDLTAFFICVVLPVCVVGFHYASAAYSTKKRSDVLIKTIECSNAIETDRLAEILGDEKKKTKTPAERLAGRLLCGSVFSLAGLVLIALSVGALCSGATFQDDNAYAPMLFGGLSLAVGLGYLIVYFATRGQVGNGSEKD